MKKFLLLSVFFLLLFTNSLFSQETPASYVEKAIAIMEQNSVNKKTIDWAAVRKEALKQTEGKKTIRETYPVIRNVLGKLGDQHSKLYEPEVVEAYFKRYKETGKEFPYPKDSLIDKKMAYITVPAIANFNQKDWDEFVTVFYKKVKDLDKKNPKCWIIDVRENDGGMLSPMLKAVYPFLDSDNTIGSIDNASEINFFNYKNSNIYFGKRNIATISIPDITLKNKNKPIYILTSKMTSSSGEFIAASFVGQKNAKIVGTNTQGLTSDNSEFKLPDNAFLVITTGILVDRKKNQYKEVGKGIPADIEVSSKELSDYINKINKL
ncbi:carboxyl-terminal processing protease [Chryseobacterium sp. H1D6B]|uniref:S41 family peptidase n=1 Tax=Chryseobacterium sp. H1D6B TaxID=2940588 RepID=UPI0015CED7F9|nr:S41 family peptidase [Chryseobacterium sp. H1D6B]MDH6252803.1 carboxyl-terminal processing protease [Chryseobacterium sp. H1D6B]